MTCTECSFLGKKYWEWVLSSTPIHLCGKSKERREAAFISSGDFAQDFMDQFRIFYDASPNWKACAFFERKASQ